MWNVLTTAYNNWSRHRSARLGAALAYYSVFSLGPILLIVISIAGLWFGKDAVRGSLTAQFRNLLGPDGAQAVEAMLKGASSVESGGIAAVSGVVLLLIAALGVVVQLKDALNTIWDAPEPEGSGLWWYIRTYLISLAGVMALGFLLMVSLVISTVLAGISTWAGTAGSEALLWEGVNFAVSLACSPVSSPCCSSGFPTCRCVGATCGRARWRRRYCSKPASSPSPGTSAAKAWN